MAPAIVFGADTLCWHLRIERGGLAVEAVLEEAAECGAEFVQVNLHHARDRDLAGHEALARRAEALGLPLLASGDFVGSPRLGDAPEVGISRVRAWLERAQALGSPVLRLASGFYRAELAGRPDLIEAERRHVVAVLRGSLDAARAAGARLLLENHSDFTAAEYRTIIDEVGADEVGVFVDLINPVAVLDDPSATVAALAPFAPAGHVKDFVFESIQTDDGYHRRGFSVLYRYPGEGVADLAALLDVARDAASVPVLQLSVEGLDNRADVDDQRERLARALAHLRGLPSRAAAPA